MTGKRPFLNAAGLGIAAFLLRPCCVLPAAAAVAGASSAGAAAALEPFRPWLIAAAGLFFAGAFYWNFIRNRNRAGMAVWAVSLVLAGGLLFANSPSGSPPKSPPPPKNSTLTMTEQEDNSLQTIELPVSGMACQACARRVEKALAAREGVSQAQAELHAATVDVVFHPAQTGPEALAEAIRKSGFKPEVEAR